MDTDTWAVIGPLYERHDELVRMASRIVGSDAEDVVHEAFIRIARSVEEGGKTGEDASAMLFTTVRNLAFNHLRDNSREEPMELGTITGMIDSPRPLTAERGMFVTNFNEALRALPRDEAEAFTLTELRGLSTREAGEILETTAMTVSRRAERARRTLAGALQ